MPGQQYQLLTNVFFSSRSASQPLMRVLLADSDCLLDAGTRLRVTTVHYDGDSFEMGFYTTVHAEVVNGPFTGRIFNISHLSDGPHAFLTRNPMYLEPVEASAPDRNTNHYAWAVSQIINHRGDYSWDWWKGPNPQPAVILPTKFLLKQKQYTLLVEAFREAATAEGKAYALSALKMLNDPNADKLAKQLIASNPTLNTLHNCTHAVEPTSVVIARMQQELEIIYPKSRP